MAAFWCKIATCLGEELFLRCKLRSSVGNECKIGLKWNAEFRRKSMIAFKFQRRFLQCTQNLKLALKVTRKVYLFARNQKNFPSWSVMFNPHRLLETTANFWSPKQHRRGFRISDPLKNTRKDSEFLIPQSILERVQNFWSPNQF